MKYIIPVENISKLEKKAKHISNKGANVIFEIGKEVQVKDSNDIYHKCYEVEADGEYKINGWNFIATIEHTSSGNIIRKAVDVEIPEKYKSTTPECEHCHTIRDRKDTYLVYNEDTNEFKQVGKSCLQSYTNGLSVNVCAELASFIEEVDKSQNQFEDYGFGGYKSSNSINALKFKKLAYPYVKANGYTSRANGGYTVEKLTKMFLDLRKEEQPMATDEEIAEVDAWVETLDTNKDYFYNAVMAWKLEYIEYRHFALIASLINTYFKDMNIRQLKAQELSNLNNEFVGEVGDKITIEVATYKSLYSKDGGDYGYNAPVSVVYKIVGKDGNVYIWSTAKNFIDNEEWDRLKRLYHIDDEGMKENGYTKVDKGTIIVATVKDHKEYKGENQTVVTRGIIYNEETITTYEALDLLK